MGEGVEGEDISLPALFDLAAQIHSVAVDVAADQEQINKGVALLRRCAEMVRKLGLFSPNETLTDVSTPSLKYLLVPFYLGELSEKVVHEDRVPILKASQDHLKEFLVTCEALELVPEAELEALRQSEVDSFETRRAKKIDRFKCQKAAAAKLQKIKERKERRGRSLRAAAFSTPIEAGGEELLDYDDDDDGEEEREAWLTTIELAICKAIDLLEMLKKEEEMLVAVANRKMKEGEKEFARDVLDDRIKRTQDWHKTAVSRAQISKPAEPITCATFAQDVIEGRASISQAHDHKHEPMIFGPASLVGGRLTSERERMAAKVFQPGYRLPTMSIEEAGLREMEIMNLWKERTAKQIEEANTSWHRDGSRIAEEDGEAEEEKARAWDDWKDDNPRGAGNKKLTPTG